MTKTLKQLFNDNNTNDWLNALTWKGMNTLNFSDESKESFKRELRNAVKEWLTQKRQFYEEKLQDSEWIELATTEEYNTVLDRLNEVKELLEELNQQ